MAQSQIATKTQQALPSSEFPFKKKEEAKIWLQNVISEQNYPKEIKDLAHSLDKKIHTKGQSWDELKSELSQLVQAVTEYQTALKQPQAVKQQVKFDLAVPTHVLQDPRIDALVQKINQLDIMREMKKEVSDDIELVNRRIKNGIEANEENMRQMKITLAAKNETIDELQRQVKELKSQKEQLENKIKSLESEIGKLREQIETLGLQMDEKDKKIKIIIEHHGKQLQVLMDENNRKVKEQDEHIEKLKIKVNSMQKENQELRKLNEHKIVAGEIAKHIIKAVYSDVHKKLPRHAFNSFAPKDIEKHMRKYDDRNEKDAAEKRWFKIKAALNWTDDTNDTLKNLIRLRNATAHPVKPPTEKIELRDALRQLEVDEDINEVENQIVYDLFKRCKQLYPDEL